MKVIILASGEGNRMFPISSLMEKSMVYVDGKPVIRHIVDRIIESGVLSPTYTQVGNKIFITVLKRNLKDFEHEFRDLDYVELIPIDNDDVHGTAHALSHALSYIEGFDEQINKKYSSIEAVRSDELIMVHYADCFMNVDYRTFVNKYLASIEKINCPRVCILVTKPGTVKHDYSMVETNKRFKEYKTSTGVIRRYPNTVTKFVEKPPLTYSTWTGVMIFQKNMDLLKEIVLKEKIPTFLNPDTAYTCDTTMSFKGFISSLVEFETVLQDKADCTTPYVIDIATHLFPYLVDADMLVFQQHDGYWYDVGNLNSFRKLRG